MYLMIQFLCIELKNIIVWHFFSNLTIIYFLPVLQSQTYYMTVDLGLQVQLFEMLLKMQTNSMKVYR